MTTPPTNPTVRAIRAPSRASKARTVARIVAGTLLLAIGLVGLLAPILPGWLLIFVGLAVLGIRLPFIERLKERRRAPRGTERDN